MLIPPSIIFVVYGIATEQSIARLFLAGILPGILLLIAYSAAILIITIRKPSLAPPAVEQRSSLQEIITSFGKGLFPVLVVFVLSMGGLFAGWFTPTEAGGVGAAGILIISFIERTMSWKKFNFALMDATRTVAMILLIVAGATIFTRTIVRSEIPFAIANWAGELPLPPFIIVIIILLICVFLGTFIEAIPLILIVTPVFYPVIVEKFGYDPIWFGVIIVMIVVMGVITPPVGINVYVTKGIAIDIPLVTIFQGIWPFLIAAIITSVIIILFPQISLFLPNLLH